MQGLEDAGLAGDAVDGARQLEQDRAVQTLVDGVEGNTGRCNTKHYQISDKENFKIKRHN